MVEKETLEFVMIMVLLFIFVTVVIFFIMGTGMTTSAFGTIKWLAEIIALLTITLCAFGLLC